MREREQYQRDVTEKVEAGWRIEEETPDRVTLVRRDFGDPAIHIVLAILTIWWTMGIANALYAAYKYVVDSERTIVWKESAERSKSDATTLDAA